MDPETITTGSVDWPSHFYHNSQDFLTAYQDSHLSALETLRWYFKQGCGSTGRLVSWFIQQYWDLQLYASFSSLYIQML